MKQPRKPTLEEKKAMSAYNLNWKEWSVLSVMDSCLKVVHKETGKIKMIDKYAREKK